MSEKALKLYRMLDEEIFCVALQRLDEDETWLGRISDEGMF